MKNKLEDVPKPKLVRIRDKKDGHIPKTKNSTHLGHKTTFMNKLPIIMAIPRATE